MITDQEWIEIIFNATCLIILIIGLGYAFKQCTVSEDNNKYYIDDTTFNFLIFGIVAGFINISRMMSKYNINNFKHYTALLLGTILLIISLSVSKKDNIGRYISKENNILIILATILYGIGTVQVLSLFLFNIKNIQRESDTIENIFEEPDLSETLLPVEQCDGEEEL